MKINPGIFQQTKYYRAAGTSNREESDLKAEKIKSIIDVRQAEVTQQDKQSTMTSCRLDCKVCLKPVFFKIGREPVKFCIQMTFY